MRLSVAMCTYNGARFLAEQLESIAAQTRLPDELVVCDDRSVDESTEIIRGFAQNAPFPVRLEVSKKNLGSTKNFEKAIGLCRGEIIALADQDDVWNPPKLVALETALKNYPEAGYVFSDAELIDERRTPIRTTLWESVQFRGAVRRNFSRSRQVATLLRQCAATGAAMAFRSSLKSILLPISECFVHDYWISLLASCVGSYGVPIPEALIRYRQHSGQQIGARRRSILDRARLARRRSAGEYNRTARGYQEVRERLLAAAAEGRAFPENHLVLVEEKIRHCSHRAAVHSAHGATRFKKVFSEALTGRYGRYSDSWKSIARDLCF